jgi:dTDP-4-dehydrorhamnose reductase
MLGSALAPWVEPGNQVIGVDRQDFDIRDVSAVRKAVVDLRPDFVYHLAAYVDVDSSEAHPQRAEEINNLGTRHVATACAEIGAVLLYVSSDYVFDGHLERPYREDDCPHPLGAYGLSKFRGEQHVQALVTRHFIVRTAWLFGLRRKNFVATVLKLANAGADLRVVSDQRGSPTYAGHLAPVLAQFSRVRTYGIYHVTGSGSCSWFEFAQAIVKAQGYDGARVIPITSQESGRPAPRPANSVLENRRLVQDGWGELPHWTDGLADYLAAARAAGESGASELNRHSHRGGPEVKER